MAANYRHIGGGENRLGRHYSRFSAFCPPQPLPVNHLLCENCRTQGRIGEIGLAASERQQLSRPLITRLHQSAARPVGPTTHNTGSPIYYSSTPCGRSAKASTIACRARRRRSSVDISMPIGGSSASPESRGQSVWPDRRGYHLIVNRGARLSSRAAVASGSGGTDRRRATGRPRASAMP